MKSTQFFIIFACLAFLSYVGYQNRAPVVSFFVGEPKTIVQVGGVKIFARVADTPEERIQGLSGTESLGDFEGMLFVFDTNDRHGIWMKGMNYPIDIAWIDREGIIVHLAENVRPETYPQTFRPDKPARYVLEMPARLAESFNIRQGQQVVIPDAITRKVLSN